MLSSNKNPPSKILKESEAEKVVFDFAPKKFPVVMPEQAKDFVQAEGGRAPGVFKINDLVAEQIGLAENANKMIEDRVEKLAIEKLQAVQEQAYAQAYALGQEEGQRDAYEAVKADLEDKVEKFAQLTQKISELKKDLVVFNEAHIVKLIGALASKVAMQYVTADQEAVIPVVTAAVEEAQNEERVVVKLAKEDFEFIQSLDDKLKKKFDNIKNLKFEIDEELGQGGCVVESNYGVIDASVEERVNRLWDCVHELAPVVKDQVG